MSAFTPGPQEPAVRILGLAFDFYTEALRLVERHDEEARFNFKHCGCRDCTPFRALIARANGGKV